MGIFRYITNQFRHDRNTKRLLNDVNFKVDMLLNSVRTDTIRRRSEWLREKTISSSESGISDEQYCAENIIVSLTTFGSRINEVYLAIESIMQGTVKPNKIILWLSKEEFEDTQLPSLLQKQKSRGLTVEYCDDIKSYKKIVPTMLAYPDSCVITIDDDLMYEYDLVENLIHAHNKFPDKICSCRMHTVVADKRGHPTSYLKWEKESSPINVSNKNFLTSGGGTLFPPHCFEDSFFNDKLFMALCPYADDIWINAHALLSNRQVVKSYTHSSHGVDYLPISLEQTDSLSSENTDSMNCRNDVQLKNVFDYFDLYHYWAD